MRVRSLSWEDSLEEGTATHSSSLACRIPWTERPGGLQSFGSQRVSHGWSDLAHTHTFLLPQTFYAVEIPGGSGTNRYFKLNHFSPRSQFKRSSFHLRKTRVLRFLPASPLAHYIVYYPWQLHFLKYTPDQVLYAPSSPVDSHHTYNEVQCVPWSRRCYAICPAIIITSLVTIFLLVTP